MLRLRAYVHWSRPEIAIAMAGEDRRFHGRRRHLGCGANTAKFNGESMGKIVILMPDNSRIDILKFL